MRFDSPEALWLLLIAPLLVALYVLMQRRRVAVRFPNVAMVRLAVGRSHRWKRHLPPALMLAAITLLILCVARPTSYLQLPSQFKTVVLAMDVSLSMQANDVDPDRITASKAAAIDFVRSAPSDVRIGLVEFAGTAAAVHQPTSNREDLVRVIERSQLQRGTATGSALLQSLAMLFPGEGIEQLDHPFRRSEFANYARGGARSLDDPRTAPGVVQRAPVPPGSYKSGVIILLTDGRRTMGPDPMEVARMAADRGVRAFTVGFGTREGGAVEIEGWSMFLKLDDEALKAVAEITRGEYFHAGSENDLRQVYEGLNNKLVLERQETEVSAFLVAGAALLALLAAALSLVWFHRSD